MRDLFLTYKVLVFGLCNSQRIYSSAGFKGGSKILAMQACRNVADGDFV